MTLAHPQAQGIIDNAQAELRRVTGNNAIMVIAYHRPYPKLTPLQIIEVICEYTCVKMPEVMVYDRTADKILARELIAFFLRSCHKLTWKNIGEIIGGRDHTTAINASRRIKDLLDTGDLKVCNAVAEINNRLEEKNGNMA